MKSEPTTLEQTGMSTFSLISGLCLLVWSIQDQTCWTMPSAKEMKSLEDTLAALEEDVSWRRKCLICRNRRHRITSKERQKSATWNDWSNDGNLSLLQPSSIPICYLPGFCFFQKHQSRSPTTPSPCSCWTNSQCLKSLKSEMVCWKRCTIPSWQSLGKTWRGMMITAKHFPKLTKCLTLDWRLLERLSNSQGNLLEDTELIEVQLCEKSHQEIGFIVWSPCHWRLFQKLPFGKSDVLKLTIKHTHLPRFSGGHRVSHRLRKVLANTKAKAKEVEGKLREADERTDLRAQVMVGWWLRLVVYHAGHTAGRDVFFSYGLIYYDSKSPRFKHQLATPLAFLSLWVWC